MKRRFNEPEDCYHSRMMERSALHIVVRNVQKEESIELARCAEQTLRSRPSFVQKPALPGFLGRIPHIMTDRIIRDD